MRMTLAVHPKVYAIHSLLPDAIIDSIVFKQDMYFIGKTDGELSIVIPADVEIQSLEKESHWRCLEVIGPLDFSMTGILARISNTLAEQKISIFAISTFDTDYILVKEDKLSAATTALKARQYKIIDNHQPQA